MFDHIYLKPPGSLYPVIFCMYLFVHLSIFYLLLFSLQRMISVSFFSTRIINVIPLQRIIFKLCLKMDAVGTLVYWCNPNTSISSTQNLTASNRTGMF